MSPGLFLRHYAPNLPSYMIGEDMHDFSSSEIQTIDISKCILIDFNKKHLALKDKVSLYMDLSESGDYVEANQNIYNYLRLAET